MNQSDWFIQSVSRSSWWFHFFSAVWSCFQWEPCNGMSTSNIGNMLSQEDMQAENCSTRSPAQLLSFTSKGLEGHLGFGKVLVPVVLHVQVDLPSPGPLPQLQGNLTAREGREGEMGSRGGHMHRGPVLSHDHSRESSHPLLMASRKLALPGSL